MTHPSHPDAIGEPAVPRCGDTVKHGPSDEEWLVAYADTDRNELAWAGWPEGRAKLSDCTLTNQCSDEEHTAAVDHWRQAYGDCRRKRTVLFMYGTPEERKP